MNLIRTPLLLFESTERELRRSARELATASTPEAYRRHAQLLRRAGQAHEADIHELHALGHERAHAEDELARHTGPWEEKKREGQAAGINWRKLAKKPELAGIYGPYRRALTNKIEKSNNWHALAAQVHQRGGNPWITRHRGESENPNIHATRMADSIAIHNAVYHRARENGEARFRGVTAHRGSRRSETRAAVERAAQQYLEAIRRHHPDGHRFDLDEVSADDSHGIYDLIVRRR